MCEICQQFGVMNPKFVLFFLNCLFFHSFVMLEQDDDKRNKFLKRYFNWGDCGNNFYHMPLSSIVSSSTQSLIVNLILKKDYLKVFTYFGAEKVGDV